MFSVQSFRPHELLTDYVDSYQLITAKFPGEMIRDYIVLPHTFQTMVFNVGDKDSIYDVNNKKYASSDFVEGPNISLCFLKISAGMKKLVVKLKPSGWYSLFGIPVNFFNNKTLQLNEVLGPVGFEISERINECNTPQEQIQIVENFLLKSLQHQKPNYNNINNVIAMICNCKGNIRIKELVSSAFITKRTMERSFLLQTGLLPKMYSRLIRFNEVIKYMAKRPGVSWITIYELFGYHDQSHFIRDFHDFTGNSPENYFAHPLDFNKILRT